MLKNHQKGTINALLLPLILLVLLLVGALVFGFWAYGGKQDYKNNVDQKIAVATSTAVKTEDATKDAQFAEESKSPLKTYVGPADYGSLHVSYPKTWSGYVDETSNGNTDVNGYFYPNFVPSTTNTTVSYALRVEILNQSYSDVLQTFESQVQAGTATITPYSLPSLKSVVGSRVVGVISGTKGGDLVILPLRDKTVQVWTEGSTFENDFNTNILPNLTFSP